MTTFTFRRVAAAAALSLLCIAPVTASSVKPAHVPRVPKPTFTVYAAGQTPGFSRGASPYSIVGGPDGNIWFTETGGQGNGNGAIAKLAPSTGTVTEYATGPSGASRPLALVVGGDGNVWFTDSAKHAIGRITPGGTIAEFTQGLSSDDTPAGITAAPDGTLWFVSNNSGPYVGHVTLDGTIAEVAHIDATLTANPSIGADAGGNLWFTGSNANQQEYLGEIQAGTLAMRTLKLESIFLPCCDIESTQAFAQDANGSLWFTNLYYGQPSDGRTPFGRIDRRIKLVGKAGTNIGSIALGADKRLWYAEQSPFFTDAAIGTIEENGRLQNRFALPSKTSPISIAGGPDGNLWLTATNGSSGLIIKATP